MKYNKEDKLKCFCLYSIAIKNVLLGSYLHHWNVLFEVIHHNLQSCGYVQGFWYINKAFLQLI